MKIEMITSSDMMYIDSRKARANYAQKTSLTNSWLFNGSNRL